MILRPRREDILSIGYYLGRIIIALGLVMLLPALFALITGEKNPALDFLIAVEISLILGLTLAQVCRTDKDINWMQGMVVVSLSWIVAALLGAIPFYLSGHWNSYLDACFDAMSGFATTGLLLVQDLDHLSLTHNLWRHLIMFIGGQGIVIVALSFFIRGLSGAFKMYVGEGRDERILPNVIQTARFIWLVSLVYFVLGVVSLGTTGMLLGLKPFSAFFQGACIFMAAFDTGGFTPHSQSIMYYHSFAFELITVMIMVAGALNFKLHYCLWMGRRTEIFKNIETRGLFISIIVLFIIVGGSLGALQIYPAAAMLFRKGFYQLISAHTGTGFQTIYPAQFFGEWNQLAIIGVIFAMGLGGAVCSTTGAIKMLRLGIIYKALLEDVKRIILPEKAVIMQKYHHIKDMLLDDSQVRSALLITLSYLAIYVFGTCAGAYFGYPVLNSLFESTSAAANVGLSCGITNAGMPAALKLTYILQMWAGRLEFMSIFTLIGFFVAAIKGR